MAASTLARTGSSWPDSPGMPQSASVQAAMRSMRASIDATASLMVCSELHDALFDGGITERI